MCVFKTNSQYSLKSLVTPFLQNGRVLYSFENKAYLKPCRVLDKSVIQISYFSTKNISCGYSKEPSKWNNSFEHPTNIHIFTLKNRVDLCIMLSMVQMGQNWYFQRKMGICLSLLAVMSLKYLSNQTKSPATSASIEANSEDLYMSMSSQVNRKSRTRQKKVSIMGDPHWMCSKIYLKWPLSKRSKIGFQNQLLLHAGQK